MDYRIGQGNDTHEIKEIKHGEIIIGGYVLKSNWKVFAYSDGDIVLHAISNAILGALQLGDIGEYFSDKDYANKNISSTKIVNFALAQMKKKKAS
ncbi:MAG: 2-C-methyl-D-erythritol 2,4-cyclodiphosphate synthase, partial [Mycoplasmataceae bacterium]|nr:2-C-methyl-D-erythritol 2,4-cyclodiphosphate synthase [Mycoplasmataceae bacterium]